ncbi:MAG: phosphoribosylglycinamide formyltransferase [Alphaproteobacteria bacterium]|nr:phosphoribosylglycinamide formyltransferase [Alphaproteobacteria bacterium]
MSEKTRVAILISGRGSNMAALIAAAKEKDYPAEIALVVSNRPEAEGLKTAQARGIQTAVLDHKQAGSREAFDGALHQLLVQQNIQLICLAGFMRLLTPGFVMSWEGRIINIHPSLLPAFKGIDAHAQTLAAGVKITGCTVHIVEPEMDSGPILAQAAVPVLPGDTEETLAARVLQAEHRLYPMALWLYLTGQAFPSDETDMLISA